MYVCMYVYTHICVYIHTHTREVGFVRRYVCIYVSIIRMYIHTFIYNVCIYVCIFVYTYTYTCLYTYIHTHTHGKCDLSGGMYVCMYHTYYVLINPPMPYITSSPLCLLRVFTSCLKREGTQGSPLVNPLNNVFFKFMMQITS